MCPNERSEKRLYNDLCLWIMIRTSMHSTRIRFNTCFNLWVCLKDLPLFRFWFNGAFSEIAHPSLAPLMMFGLWLCAESFLFGGNNGRRVC